MNGAAPTVAVTPTDGNASPSFQNSAAHRGQLDRCGPPIYSSHAGNGHWLARALAEAIQGRWEEGK